MTRGPEIEPEKFRDPARGPARFIPLFLALITTGVFLPILWHDFVQLDDGLTVYANKALIRLDASSFSSFWTSPQNDLYAPLTYTVYAGASLLAHGRRDSTPEGYQLSLFAWPFHLCSLLIHLLAVLVVYAILRRLIGKPWPCAAGTLLFSLHPVQVESVAWVTALNGTLCSLFLLCAIYCYLRAIDAQNGKKPSTAWMILATEAFLLALLAKPLAIVVPILGGIVYWMVTRREESRPRGVWLLFVWTAMAIPFAIVARKAQPIPDWWITVPIWHRPFVAGDTVSFYIFKLLWPLRLVPDYTRPPNVIARHVWFYVAWIVPALFAVVLLRCAKRRGTEPLIAGAMWFIAAMIPVLGFAVFAFQRSSTAADRYLYLPMFGISLIVAWILSRATRHRFVTVTIAIAILLALGTKTMLQLRYWRDTPALFKHCIEITGREPGVREN